MKILVEKNIPSNTGVAFEVNRGQCIRVIGESTVDFVVFNRHNLRERFDQARTKTDQGKIFISTGDLLISKDNNVLMTIVEDTYSEGTHDLQKGMCSGSLYKKWGEKLFAVYGGTWTEMGRTKRSFPEHGCWENLTEALKSYQIASEDIPSPLNIFQTMTIDSQSGRMRYAATRPRPGSHIDFRAEIDCLVGISACPEGGRGKDIQIVIYEINTSS